MGKLNVFYFFCVVACQEGSLEVSKIDDSFASFEAVLSMISTLQESRFIMNVKTKFITKYDE